MPALAARAVSLTYRTRGGAHEVLRELSFDVRGGEFLSVVGPSGCGKTSVLRMFAGLVRPTAGACYREEAPIDGPPADVAFVFQDYGRALLPWRTVRANVELALEARDVPVRERAALVGALLRQVGLQGHAAHYPLQLSGGLQQRVQIARCLAQAPRVLLMDEPFGALDAMTRQGLQDELAALCARTGMTVVFVTHDLEEAIYLGDRVIALDANPGRILEVVDVAIPRPRDQLATREDPRFLGYRHRLFELLRPR